MNRAIRYSLQLDIQQPVLGVWDRFSDLSTSQAVCPCATSDGQPMWWLKADELLINYKTGVFGRVLNVYVPSYWKTKQSFGKNRSFFLAIRTVVTNPE